MKQAILVGVTLLVYSLVQAAVVGGLYFARAEVREIYATSHEQQSWEEFRQEMDSQHAKREAWRTEVARRGGQPEAAKPPKPRSEIPPALELLENRFGTCLITSISFTTVLFVVIWGLVLGVMLRPVRKISADELRAK